MIRSINPYNGEKLAEHSEFTSEEIKSALKKADETFKEWKKTSFAHRKELLLKVAEDLKENSREFAQSITLEMGKPISQSIAEVEKCAWVCEYYAENAQDQLAAQQIATDGHKSYVTYEPLGLIFAIMPWNYPFWQVFRFIAPALMAGNVGVLKHASNVMLSAKNLEKIFLKAGFPEGCFQNLVIGSDLVEEVIKDRRVKAITLTGSEGAGSAVAKIAGGEIKKTVLELGGSNALVVFEDANLQESAKICVQARFQNTGQSCIAGKRLLLQDSIAEEFLNLFIEEARKLKSGDPMDETTDLGVLAREDLAKDLEKQVKDSLDQGAKLIMGGERNGAYYAPTILTKVSNEMPVFKEETFGPAIGISTFNEEKEAVEIVNQSKFGLGVSIFTQDFEKAQRLIPEFEDGAVFVNELVKSDPRLPFGGTKMSGYGRELSFVGIREFVNIKTVYFKKI